MDRGVGAPEGAGCSVRFSSGGFAGHDAWHHHPEYELGWIVGGQGTLFVGDCVEPYRVNDLVLLGPNLPHFYDVDASPRGARARPELVTLQFRSEVVDTHFLGLPEARGVAALLRVASQRGLRVRGETAARVQERVLSSTAKAGMARLIGLLEILEILAEGHDDLRPLASLDYLGGKGSAATTRRRIEQIDRHVRENLGREIKQVDVAGLVGLTPHAFSRFFRRATGQTFVGFVNRLRISEACRRLLETNDGITEIAFGCGYWSIANFNRQFLNLKGVNPSRFREQRFRMSEAMAFSPIAERRLEVA